MNTQLLRWIFAVKKARGGSREFCGRPLHLPDELFRAVSQIEQRKTRVHARYTMGFCERFHRTASDEPFKVACRQELYLLAAELQADLNAWLEQYNTARPHHGYRTQGAPPLQARTDGLTVSREEVPGPA